MALENYVVAVEGLKQLGNFGELPADIVQAARRAVNATTKRARAAAAREIGRQVNFGARYLSGDNGRLRVKKYASGADLEGIVEGRHRATSLARFATGSPRRGGGVTVQVKPGAARYMRRAFLMRLRRGTALTDTQHNLGLAIRLKPGETIRNKREVMAMGGGLYLLYGPSVDQVFGSVAGDIAPDAADYLESEFLRLLEVK